MQARSALGGIAEAPVPGLQVSATFGGITPTLRRTKTWTGTLKLDVRTSVAQRKRLEHQRNISRSMSIAFLMTNTIAPNVKRRKEI